MNSYQNQYRRMPGKGDCRMPEMREEKACCRMPEMREEKVCCRMPEVQEEKGCFSKPEPRVGKECCCNEDNRWPVGMTYVPMQQWRELYQPEEGLHNGTIFKELDLPFIGRRMC